MLLAKATLLLLCTLALGALLRRASAAQRAALYCAALAGLLLLPFLSVVAPPMIPVWLPVQPLSSLPLARVPSRLPAVLPAPTFSAPPQGVSPPAPSLATVTPFPWERVVVLLLALGSVLSLLRVGLGLLGLRRFVRESTRAADPLQAEVFTLATSLHLWRLPDVRIASDTLGLCAPLTFGWWRGIILLPESALAEPQALRVALLHELVHLRRRDWLVLLLARLTAALWWFHPLVHVLIRQLRFEIEAACDDRVLRHGVSAPDYAGYLVSFSRHASGERL